MRLSLLTGLTLLLLSGCQSLADQEALRPLPEAGPKPTYTDLLLRARRQSDIAMDRAFRNLWMEVEDASRALEQTVKLIPTAQELPEKKPEMQKLWAELAVDAKRLEAVARDIPPLTGADRKKKQDEVDQLLLRLSRNVRTLRALN
jgi:hypothetical protein